MTSIGRGLLAGAAAVYVSDIERVFLTSTEANAFSVTTLTWLYFCPYAASDDGFNCLKLLSFIWTGEV